MDYIWNLISNNLGDIISFVIGIGVVVPFLVKAKVLIQKCAKLISDIDTILEDDKISNDEIAKIKADAIDVWTEIKSLVVKK